ncbi:MAG: antitoxin [Candidatus Dormibacteraeota bacterium]|nr:antitoxin [Candidatus Dormibacteraeota bacterium]MBV9525828.1 antitoxin [Candidatus Dormibacteraeota bacterium]
MRTTITLDPDVEALLKRVMERRGLGLKAAVNEGLRRGLSAGDEGRPPYRLAPHSMGAPLVPLQHALRLAAEMEDEAILAKMREGR